MLAHLPYDTAYNAAIDGWSELSKIDMRDSSRLKMRDRKQRLSAGRIGDTGHRVMKLLAWYSALHWLCVDQRL